MLFIQCDTDSSALFQLALLSPPCFLFCCSCLVSGLLVSAALLGLIVVHLIFTRLFCSVLRSFAVLCMCFAVHVLCFALLTLLCMPCSGFALRCSAFVIIFCTSLFALQLVCFVLLRFAVVCFGLRRSALGLVCVACDMLCSL